MPTSAQPPTDAVTRRRLARTEALRGGGRQPQLDDQAREFIRQLVDDSNHVTLAQLSQRVEQKFKKRVSLSTLCRVLESIGLPRKKRRSTLPMRDTPRVEQARADYQLKTAELELRRYKFIDESGFNLAMTPMYGRAPRGERAVGSVPINYGSNQTLIGALSSSGLQALMTVEGATDGYVFRAYVEEVL